MAKGSGHIISVFQVKFGSFFEHYIRCYHFCGCPVIGLIGRFCFLFMQQATMPPMVSATVVSMKKAAMAHGTANTFVFVKLVEFSLK